MIGEPSETNDIEDIVVGIFDTILQYDSGKLSQDLALKKGFNIIEGLKGIDEPAYQEVKRDFISVIKGNT